MEWRNQVAVVTGGSRGIGRATARLLAQRGAAVCVNYAVNADAAEALVAEITTAGGRAIAVVADVADSAAVEAMVTHTEAGLDCGDRHGARRQCILCGNEGRGADSHAALCPRAGPARHHGERCGSRVRAHRTDAARPRRSGLAGDGATLRS